MRVDRHLWLYCLPPLFWSGSYIAIRFIVLTYSPLWAAALRLVFALLTFRLIFLFRDVDLRVPLELRWRMWRAGLLSQGLPFAILFCAERLISPGVAGIFNGTVPIWTLLLGAWFLRRSDSFHLFEFLGIAVGLIGVVLVFLPAVSVSGRSGELLGTVMVWLMAVSYASGTIANRRLMLDPRWELFASLYHQHWASLVFLSLVAFAFSGAPRLDGLSVGALAAIVYLGVFSTAVSWIAFYRVMKLWGVLRASSMNYLVPLLTLLLDFLFFGHVPEVLQVAGALTILTGVAVLQGARIVRLPQAVRCS